MSPSLIVCSFSSADLFVDISCELVLVRLSDPPDLCEVTVLQMPIKSCAVFYKRRNLQYRNCNGVSEFAKCLVSIRVIAINFPRDQGRYFTAS